MAMAMSIYRTLYVLVSKEINSQSLEDTQVEYISQKYTLKNTLYPLRCGVVWFLLRATRDWKSERVTNLGVPSHTKSLGTL